MIQDTLRSSILRYIVDKRLKPQDEGRLAKLPAMGELCRLLGISRGKLREELIAAEACGVVEMRPGDGTYVRRFDFYTPIRTLVLYGVTLDRKNFWRYYELRTHLESAMWEDATRKLSSEDVEELQRIVERARCRLEGEPREIPHREHREFHLLTFARLENEFVQGLLRAYWDAYEAVGLHLYFDFSYYEAMWASHKAIAEAIAAGQYGAGREVLAEHFTLLRDRLWGNKHTG